MFYKKFAKSEILSVTLQPKMDSYLKLLPEELLFQMFIYIDSTNFSNFISFVNVDNLINDKSIWIAKLETNGLKLF